MCSNGPFLEPQLKEPITLHLRYYPRKRSSTLCSFEKDRPERQFMLSHGSGGQIVYKYLDWKRAINHVAGVALSRAYRAAVCIVREGATNNTTDNRRSTPPAVSKTTSLLTIRPALLQLAAGEEP
jgi:hypothetical protein